MRFHCSSLSQNRFLRTIPIPFQKTNQNRIVDPEKLMSSDPSNPEERQMTPQERELIADLFDRLAQLERQPYDPDAERAIRDGLRRAPHAIYPLVQTVLVQDEALKAANARIEALESSASDATSATPSGFLDNMRDVLFGRTAPGRGS